MIIINEKRYLEWGIEPTIDMEFKMDSNGDEVDSLEVDHGGSTAL